MTGLLLLRRRTTRPAGVLSARQVSCGTPFSQCETSGHACCVPCEVDDVESHRPATSGRALSPVIFCECGCGGRRCTYCGVVGETTECATCAEVTS